MNCLIPFLSILQIMLAATASQGATAVQDKAQMFAPETVESAEKTIAEIRDKTGWHVVVASVESMPKEYTEMAWQATARTFFNDEKLSGVILLFSKDSGRVLAQATLGAQLSFNRQKMNQIQDALSAAVTTKNLDEGLSTALAELQRMAIAAPVRPAIFGVRDRGKAFSEENVARAEEIIMTIQRDNHWDVLLETIDTIGRRDIRAFAKERWEKEKPNGLYIFVVRAQRKTCILSDPEHSELFPPHRIADLEDTLNRNLAAHQPTKGLLAMLTKVRAQSSREALSVLRGVEYFPTSRPLTNPDPGSRGLDWRDTVAQRIEEPPGKTQRRSGLQVLTIGLAGISLAWLAMYWFRRNGIAPVLESPIDSVALHDGKELGHSST